MALADLLKDTRLHPDTRDADLRRLTADFVRRRVRRLVELNPADADPARPGDITAAATRALADLIAGELPKVRAASEEIMRRVSADPAHLPLDPATIRKRGTKRPPLPVKAAKASRRALVRCIAYQAAAADVTLADPGSLDRLHRLCDRRLRIVERMLYDVGRADGRAWSRAQIESHRGGPWLDGYERLFEYPRVPRSVFLPACRPDQFARCTAPMQAWGHPTGDFYLHALAQSNPGTRASWALREEYELDYAPAGGLDAVAAIQKLFEPSPDYLARNLMYCDHTIHALHLEALVFAMTKRGRGTAWLSNEVAAQGARWLRIHAPLGIPGHYLGGSDETLFFEHVTVRQADLQVGDQLIVYNHPAYAKATVGGVWRLENAVVVQTSPDLLMQGHGSPLRDQGGMWKEMISLFSAELEQRRADVEGLARVQGFGPNTLTVDTTKFLASGMRVDIVRDDLGEAVLAPDRQITSMADRVIRYDGNSVTSPTRHRLRRARTRAFNGAYEAVNEGTFLLVRRVAPAVSQYDAASQRADWFLAWFGDDGDEAIRKDGVRAAFVKSQHLIDYTQERDDTGKTRTVGWFPLWRPSRKGGGPLRRDGKIVRIEPVTVEPRQVAGWTWFFDPDPAKRDLVPVLRPREL